MLSEGQQFPEFSLQDQDGNRISNADLKGSKAILYFYPKDDTPGCTVEACEFQSAAADLKAAGKEGARVLGVSPDSPKSHRKFADKFNLSFTLLADVDHALADSVGVWVEKSMYGKKYMGVDRTTFVLDEQGKVAKIYSKVKPEGHAGSVISEL
jgi:thioredoxin-dependent peroxiredoxin